MKLTFIEWIKIVQFDYKIVGDTITINPFKKPIPLNQLPANYPKECIPEHYKTTPT